MKSFQKILTLQNKLLLRNIATSTILLAKIEVTPKYSLVDERLTSTILSDLTPNQTGYISYLRTKVLDFFLKHRIRKNNWLIL